MYFDGKRGWCGKQGSDIDSVFQFGILMVRGLALIPNNIGPEFHKVCYCCCSGLDLLAFPLDQQYGRHMVVRTACLSAEQRSCHLVHCLSEAASYLVHCQLEQVRRLSASGLVADLMVSFAAESQQMVVSWVGGNCEAHREGYMYEAVSLNHQCC